MMQTRCTISQLWPFFLSVSLLQIKSFSALIHYTRTNARINLQRGNQKRFSVRPACQSGAVLHEEGSNEGMDVIKLWETVKQTTLTGSLNSSKRQLKVHCDKSL